MIGLIVFIITWVICFKYSYKMWYKFMTIDDLSFEQSDRLLGVIICSLHIVSVVILLGCLLMEGELKFGLKEDGSIGKILKSWEK